MEQLNVTSFLTYYLSVTIRPYNINKLLIIFPIFNTFIEEDDNKTIIISS